MKTRKILELYIGVVAKLLIRFHRPTVIAVTGSAGKTTTTTVIVGMFESLADCGVTPSMRTNCTSNMNGTVGLPLVIAGSKEYLNPDFRSIKKLIRITGRALYSIISREYPRVLVLECGISRKGEMQAMAQMIRPDISIVTTVGAAHLERGMNTVEQVANEKAWLVRKTRSNGQVLLGSDSELTSEMASQTRAKVELIPGKGLPFAIAVAEKVGSYLQLPPELVAKSLEDPKLPPHRLSRHKVGDVVLIDDTFNANPVSMRLALDTLSDETSCRRRVAILGDMGQLGEEAEKYHREIGSYAHARTDVVLGVGQLAKQYNPSHYFENATECGAQIKSLIQPGDCVLVKGSHSVNMYKVVEALLADA